VTTDFSLKDVNVAGDRLRSWAKIRDVPVTGPPLLVRIGELSARVHLPIGAEVMPHPETGIELDAVPAGVVARIGDVRFSEVRAVGREALVALSPGGLAGAVEFHSIDGDFVSGELAVLVPEVPSKGPAVLSLPDLDGPLTSQPLLPVPTRVVTIARQHGTGGEVVAANVARNLGFRLIDYGVFRTAAEKAGVSPENLENAAHHRSLLTKLLESMALAGPGSPEMWVQPVTIRTTPLFSSREYRSFVEEAIRDLAAEGDVVIVGHGAQLVLADRPGSYRVLIAGGVEARVARAAQQGVPTDEARRSIEEADAERVAYFREFYSSGWLDPASYDLVINTDRTSVAAASRIIVDAFKAHAEK